MRPLLVVVLLCALGVAPARAVELDLGWTGRTAWESNVFHSSDDEESDFSVLTGPDVRVREHTRAFRLDAGYRLLYEEFIELDGLGSFEHFLDGRARWQATPRDTFSFEENFSHTESLIQLSEVGATGLVTELVPDREPISRNVVSGEYRRRLGPLWELGVSAGNTAYWFDSDTRSNSLSTTTSVDLTRTLSERQTVGAGLAFTLQDFDDTEFTRGSSTRFYQVYGIWRYLVTRTLSISVSGGPRLAQPDELEDSGFAQAVPVRRTGVGTFVVSPTGCPAFAPGVVRFTGTCGLASAVRVDPNSIDVDEFDFLEDRPQPDDNLGFFGRAAVTKEWKNVTTVLSYERSASTASGIAASTELDVATWRVDWRPSRSWHAVGVASWERQRSISELPRNEILLSATGTTLLVDDRGRIVTDPADAVSTISNAAQTVGLRTAELVDNAIDITTTRLELQLHRDLTRRILVSGRATWWRQDFQGDVGTDEPVNDVRLELSLTWRLAPIDL